MRRSTFAFRERLMRSTQFASFAILGTGALAAPLALAQTVPPPPAAQPAPTPQPATGPASAEVEEVKVTSRLREEKAQDVPLPVSVVGGKTADREHIERLQDFAEKVPNFVPYTTNPRTSAIAIRGITGISGGADGSESATGFIVDNVFFTHVGFQWADYVDLQSLEVARGPQGTLLGKNTTVGAVVIHTQAPSFTPSATLESSFGNYNRFIEKLNVTGPIIPDRVAGRFTLFLDKGDGWIHDAVTGAGLLDNNRWGARGQLLFTFDDFTDRVIFDRLRSDEYNNYGAPAYNSFPFYANGALATSFSSNLANRLHWPLLGLDPYSPELSDLRNLDQRTTGLSNEFNKPIGDNVFTSVAAWREFTLHPNNTGSTTTGGTVGQDTFIESTGFDTYVDQYSFENRLASPKDVPLEWTVGTYFLREVVNSHDRETYGPQAAQWFLNSFAANPAVLNGSTSHQDGIARTFSAAAFAQTSWHIDDKWTLTTGLRNTYEIREGSDFGWINGNTTAAGIGAANTAQGYSFFDTGGQTTRTNSISGLINPSYRFSENVLAYGSVARGEKSGAINTNALPLLDSAGNFKGFQPVITKPEVSWDYELGVKTNWFDNKLIVNANLFWNDIYDFQAILVDTSILDVTGVPIRKTYLGNIPQVRSRGFEFDTRWSPLERLWITFNGQATDFRYVSYPQAAPPADWTWPASANIKGVAAPLYVNLSGQRVTSGVNGNAPFSPYSFNLGANYEYPLGPVLRPYGLPQSISMFGYGNLTWRYKSQLSEPYSLYYLQQPSYSLINAGLGFKTDDEKYSFNLWVKNLADSRYLIAATIGSPTAPGNITFGENNPRTFGATLRVKLY